MSAARDLCLVELREAATRLRQRAETVDHVVDVAERAKDEGGLTVDEIVSILHIPRGTLFRWRRERRAA